jgi:hypothetical protein
MGFTGRRDNRAARSTVRGPGAACRLHGGHDARAEERGAELRLGRITGLRLWRGGDVVGVDLVGALEEMRS